MIRVLITVVIHGLLILIKVYMTLSTEEIIRYSRHLNLPQFGLATQEKLKLAKVLIIGVGGLGAPLLQYLTAAGVGTLGIVDFDHIEMSNLQRQVLFGTADIGATKTKVAIKKLENQNPHINFIEHPVRLDSNNAIDIINQYDIVADGTDNFPTRYLVNDACVLTGKPNVFASIYQFEGQVSVFNYRDKKGQIGPNYRDLFANPPPPGLVPSCAEGGVLGVLPGIIGSMQASEVIKIISGIGEPLSGRLFIFDALDFTSQTVKLKKDPTNPLTGENPTITTLIDYEVFCGLDLVPGAKSITVDELNKWISEKRAFQLIDVRESYENEIGNIGGKHIPIGEIQNHLEDIAINGDVVLYCKSGVRSRSTIDILQLEHGYKNLINLEGGLLAWKQSVDPDLQVV